MPKPTPAINRSTPEQSSDRFSERPEDSYRLMDDDDEMDKKHRLSWTVIVAIVLLMVVGVSSIPAIVGGGRLLKSIDASSAGTFSCKLLDTVGIAVAVVGSVVLLVVLTLGFLSRTWSWPSRASRYTRDQTRRAVVIRFGAAYVLQIIALLIMIAASIGAWALYGLSANIPHLSKSYDSVPGIDGEVSIVRDDAGVTHIKAKTKRDAVFGQGFVHGQDRLWEIEFQRLAAKGELAKYVGKPGVKFDKQTRTLNFVNAAKTMCENLSAEEREILESYTAGINYYLKADEARPVEFFFMSRRLLFYHEPDQFTADDVCLAGRLLQWRLSFNIQQEIARFKIWWKTGRSYGEVQQLYTNQTNITGTILNPEQMNFTEADAVNARAREARDYDIEEGLYDNGWFQQQRSKYTSFHSTEEKEEEDLMDDASWLTKSLNLHDLDLMEYSQRDASNAWAGRSAGKTGCGASDPHLTVNLPSVWYYAHLEWEGFHTAGVGMLGIPGVHIGKNKYVSWGITMSLTDLTDLYVLVPDEKDPGNSYIHNGKSVKYGVRTERIEVKGGDAIELSVKESLYGPVATEALKLPSQLNFAVWSQSLRPDSTTITSIVNFLNENVTTVKALRDLVWANMRSPGFSIPMADHEGNIGYAITGAHIVRSPGHTGTFPALGDGSFDLMKEIPYPELPTIIDMADRAKPTAFAIGAANQKIYPDGYKYTLGYDYAYPYRGKRAQELLFNNPDRLSDVDFHVEIQTDIRSNVWWNHFRPLFLDNKTIVPGDSTNGQEFNKLLNDDARAWCAELLAWDGRLPIGSVTPTFLWWWIRSISATPSDALKVTGAPYWLYDYAQRLFTPTARMNKDCELRLTKAVPGVDHCVALAAQEFNSLATSYPLGSLRTQWGIDVNRLYATHLMMHGTPLACMFERWSAKDGDWTSIDVADSDLKDRIDVTRASSMRQIYDWSRPDTVHFALPGGESGNPYSWRYDNLLLDFSEDKYRMIVVANVSSVTSTTSSQSLRP